MSKVYHADMPFIENQCRPCANGSAMRAHVARLLAMVPALFAVGLATGCKTVVTSTTEVRPNRYAVTEFAREISRDSLVALATRALAAEGLKLQRVEAGTVTSTAKTYPAAAGEPELEAVVTISSEMRGDQTWIRIVASAVLPAGSLGGQDPRLVELVHQVRQRMESES